MASTSNSPPPISFHIAFERLKDVLCKDDARAIASTSLEDVGTAAKEIERQLELRRSLRGLRRIQPFLAGIEQYSKVVEVICNGTPYLPYLWAPIKLLLQIAQTHISSLEKLIDAYAMIGEAMPRFDKLSGAFKDDPEFLQVMGHFYEDVLEFHRRAYKFFRRRAWRMFFDSLWKTFDSRFQAILQSLRKHRDLIDQEASTINIVEAKVWRGQQLEQIRQWRAEQAKDLDKAERERLGAQIREAVMWFGAAQEQEDIPSRLLRACNSTDSHWALQEPMILSWLGQSRDNQFLWLHGKPGAGKSVICAKVIEHVQDSLDANVIFYFCNHHHTSQSSANDILRSFATQLLAANTELAPYILETFVNQALRPTKKHLGVILEKLITSLSSVKVVVDGLDECLTSEQEEIIGDLQKIKGSVPGACKILLSCRKLPSLSRLLQDKPTLRLDDHAESVNATISSFVHHELESLRQKFHFDLIDELEGQIIARANGMFLWVSLVLYTLRDLHFEREIREATQALPVGLEAVYEKILSRICGNSRAPNQRTATRILQWMLVARRPLKRCEIESGITLDDQISRITLATRPRGDVLSSCYPILDVEDGPCGIVSFCHFTALEYLRTFYSSPTLQYPPAQLTVSLACVLYLVSSFDLIDPRLPIEEIRSQISQCFHDLHLYANDHWLDHLSALANSPADSIPSGSSMASLIDSLERLTQRHNEIINAHPRNAQNDGGGFSSGIEEYWPQLEMSTATQSLLNTASAYRLKSAQGDQIATCSFKPGGQDDPTLFSSIRARFQSLLEESLEQINLSDTVSGDFAARHRSGSYLCRYWSCPRAVQGFDSSDLRQEHENSHTPRFRCNDVACRVFAKGLTSRAAINKHNKKYHCNDGLAAIPRSLRTASARPQQDKARFLLKEPSPTSQKASFHAAGEEKLMNEVHMAQNAANSIQDLRPSITKCICGIGHDDIGYMIQCDICDTVQHFQCYYVNEDYTIMNIENNEHCCLDCKPRPLDAEGAANRQMERKSQRTEDAYAMGLARDVAKKNPTISSYWTVPEQEVLPIFIRHYGTNWREISNHMMTKTSIMVRNYYNRAVKQDKQLAKAFICSKKDYQIKLRVLEWQNRKRLRLGREAQSADDHQNPISPARSTQAEQQSGGKNGLGAEALFPLDDYQLQLMLLEQQNKKRKLLQDAELQRRRDEMQLVQAEEPSGGVD